jgi:DNA-directed RNA polymerase subunit M/transcription elongation factor TFIIS
MSKRTLRNIFNNIPFTEHKQVQISESNQKVPLTSTDIYKLLGVNPEFIQGNPLYSCKKCKGTNVTYVLKQLRAADEGMTPIFTCVDCHAFWKGSS